MKQSLLSLPSFFAGLCTAALLAVLALAGCAVVPSPSMNNNALDSYHAELERLRSLPAPPTKTGEQGVAAWKALLADLSVDNVKGRAAQVYAEETFFNDTLKTIRSADAVEEYLIETGELLNSGTVEYRDTVRTGDGSYYVRWEMVYSGKKLGGGKPIRTIGMSHLIIDADGRVALHQDFWDSTRGIFQHIPIVGSQIRFIQKRL